LILQYILYSKNEKKKSRLDLNCRKAIHSKRAFFPASTKNRPIFKIEKTPKWQNQIATIHKENAVCDGHAVMPMSVP
jgi:hypothetical protein